MHACVCVCVCVCVYVYTLVYTYKHTHTHAQQRMTHETCPRGKKRKRKKWNPNSLFHPENI
jgi:Ca2+/H+ antiporter